MREAHRLWTLVSPVAIAMLGGCGVLDPSEMIDVQVTLSDSLIKVSGTIEIAVTATNRGGTDVSVGAKGCPQTFQVMDASGTVVGPETVLCTLEALPPRTLKPGESIGFGYRWAGGGLGPEGSRLPAGPYLVRGQISVFGEGVAYSPPRSVRVLDG